MAVAGTLFFHTLRRQHFKHRLITIKLNNMAEEKTVISIKKPTPEWANWVFRSVLLIATTLNTAIVNAPGIDKDTQLNIVYWSGLVVTIIWGLSRTLGLKIDPPAAEVRRFTDGPGDILPPPPKKPKDP